MTGGTVAGVRAYGARAILAELAGAAIVTATAAAWRPAREAVRAAAWCVITPHRVRTCLAQSWACNRSGKLLAVIRASATPAGERVMVWCGAGTSFENIEACATLLAAACWARHAIVTRSDRFAHIVYIDVIRRTDWRPWAGNEQSPGEPDPRTPPWPDGGPGEARSSGLPDDDRRNIR
jgi:hypothetical protein